MLGYERARDAISAHVIDEDKMIIKGGDLPLCKAYEVYLQIHS